MKHTILLTKKNQGCDVLYRAVRKSLPMDFTGSTPDICTKFVAEKLGRKPQKISIEVSTQPFEGSNQIFFSFSNNLYATNKVIKFGDNNKYQPLYFFPTAHDFILFLAGKEVWRKAFLIKRFYIKVLPA